MLPRAKVFSAENLRRDPGLSSVHCGLGSVFTQFRQLIVWWLKAQGFGHALIDLTLSATTITPYLDAPHRDRGVRINARRVELGSRAHQMCRE